MPLPRLLLGGRPIVIPFFDEEYGTMLNVMDYGAVGNGTTDDRAAIQSAIDAAAGGGGGYRVYLPKATYGIGNELIVKQEVQLIGDGPVVTTIKALGTFSFASQEVAMLHQRTANGTDVKLGTFTPMGRIYLRNLQLDGNSNTGANGILAACQQPASWDNVRVNNCPGNGIALADGQQIVMNNIEIIGCGTGLLVSGHAFVYVDGLNIEVSGTYAIYLKRGISNSVPFVNRFCNVHIEHNAGAATLYIKVNEADMPSFDNVWVTAADSSTVFQFDNNMAYTLKNIRPYAADITTVTALVDTARSINANAWTQFQAYIPFLATDNGHFGNYIATDTGLVRLVS